MLKIKRGDIYAESLACQSYLYRLGHLWINILMSEDGRNTSLNPLKVNIIDIAWIALAIIWVPIYLSFQIGYTPWKALSMKNVKPLEFDWGGRLGKEWCTDYKYQDIWYYDNVKKD